MLDSTSRPKQVAASLYLLVIIQPSEINTVDENSDDFHRFDMELSDRETLFIGKIVALWGAIEHEIFTQTLIKICPDGNKTGGLPSGMNNAQFSQVLELWKTHILNEAKGELAETLQQQYAEINRLSKFRHANALLQLL